MTQAYPLQWPAGRPRTKAHLRYESRFDVTADRARQELVWEVERMGGQHMVISTNVPLRRDGYPYAHGIPDGGDPGVAVYFVRKKQQICFSCDQYHKVWENMRAIGKTIEAMRGIQRWGAEEMLDRAFTGFTALPSPDAIVTPATWWETLGITARATDAEVKEAFMRLYQETDDPERQRALMAARDKARMVTP